MSNDSPLKYIASRIPLVRVTAPQFAAAVIRQAIVTGAISGRDALRQDLIASDLNTSKVPVREALRELEGQGLVEFVPNRGFMVKPPSLHEMRECFELRAVLEPLAVRHSVPLATREHLDAVERIIDEFELVDDPLLTSQWNLTLHIAFYAPAQMSHLENMITRAHTIAQRYTYIHMRLRSAEIDSQAEHRAILAAYREKDVDLAVDLMTSHITKAADEVIGYLEGASSVFKQIGR